VVQNTRGQAGRGIVIKDAIADITLQQVLTRPEDFDVIATLNLNGDYLSDALAAQWAGSGSRGREHQLRDRACDLRGDARDCAQVRGSGQGEPRSVILSGVMMLEHMGWQEGADLILRGSTARSGRRR